MEKVLARGRTVVFNLKSVLPETNQLLAFVTILV